MRDARINVTSSIQNPRRVSWIEELGCARVWREDLGISACRLSWMAFCRGCDTPIRGFTETVEGDDMGWLLKVLEIGIMNGCVGRQLRGYHSRGMRNSRSADGVHRYVGES